MSDRFGFQGCGCERQVFTFASDSIGHIAESDERLLPGVSLENPKAAGGEHPQWVLKSQMGGILNGSSPIVHSDFMIRIDGSKSDEQRLHTMTHRIELPLDPASPFWRKLAARSPRQIISPIERLRWHQASVSFAIPKASLT